MSLDEAMHRVDTLLSHVWMVRTFLKHSEEAEDDEELADIYRGLYDYMLALGGPLRAGDSEAYFRQARKKYTKLKRVTELFIETQPEISSHTNFQMAAQSLKAAVEQIGEMIDQEWS